jgi:anaerobic selenocysteine-containing dehydrogenase
MQWTPERTGEVCGITANEVRALAKAYGETAKCGEPVGIRLNYGMQRTHGGGNAVRAVACLPALVGAWRQRAGGMLLSSSGSLVLDRTAIELPDLLPAQFANQPPRTINMSTIGDDLLRNASPEFGPKVQALIVYNSNPVAVAPDSAKVVQGFARDDLFTVVLEHFHTDTADYADYILPATTQLEHWDLHTSYGHTDVLLNRPAIAPQGASRSNAEIFRNLAQAMGWTDACFSESDESLCQTVVGKAVPFDTLLEKGFATIPLPDAPFAQGQFATASGKCEFFSAQLAAQGLDGLPDYLPNRERPQAQDAYPLAMISPPARNFLNSTFVNVKSLRDIEGEPLLEISSDDAQPRGIASGDTVRVFNARGEHRCKAKVSQRARAGVVNGLGIWWRKLGMDGTNVNQLTSQQLTDLGNGPTFYDCAVQVERVAA